MAAAPTLRDLLSCEQLRSRCPVRREETRVASIEYSGVSDVKCWTCGALGGLGQQLETVEVA